MLAIIVEVESIAVAVGTNFCAHLKDLFPMIGKSVIIDIETTEKSLKE